jgi:hypothetical protein
MGRERLVKWGLKLPSRQVPPSAAALIESLRGTGYSLETALADLIDNSIAAQATVVDLSLEWNKGAPYILIADDGNGMTEDGLIEAMRFGGSGPSGARAATDLGRFGLGLKTASLSQCRRLTVVSKRDGKTSAYCWDLDYIRMTGASWELLEGIPPDIEASLPHLSHREAGTLVFWDRIDFGRLRERPTLSAFLSLIDHAEHHLAMVFHRFLAGDSRKLHLTLNGRRLKAWDPFLEDHPATIPRPEQSFDSGGERILVRGYILPHPDRFANADELDKAGGPEGWTAQQGFYVYRQKRLLSAGGWLGLGGSRAWTREEFSRLARIRIDLPNTIDEDWRIDIRKSQARPPIALLPDLARIAGDVRRISREVFWSRGRRAAPERPDGVERIWQVNSSAANRRYVVRRDHPLVMLLRAQLGSQADLLDSTFDLIERTVPVDRIWLDAAEEGPPTNTAPGPDSYKDLLDAARSIVRTMISSGLERQAAIAAVSRMAPFDCVPDIVSCLRAS